MDLDDEWLKHQVLSTDRTKRTRLQDVLIICLNDRNDNAEQEHEFTLLPTAKLFDNVDECLDYITDIQENTRVYLVLSRLSLSNSEKMESLLSILQSMTSVHRIYLLNHSDEIKRMPEFPKVKSIVSFVQLKRDIRSTEEHMSLAFSVVNDKSICSSLHAEKRNKQEANFMYTQLFKQIVLATDSPVHEKQERAEMIAYCRSYYTEINNQSALTFLERYELDESHHSAIWWYSCDGFLYKMLNEACRIQDIETMYAMRVFIRDLHREIEQLCSLEPSRSSTLILYRGQQLSRSAFKEIQSKSGGLLSINSFFSTSLKSEVALMFAGVSDSINTIAIVFQIIVPPVDTKVVPFANIDSVSAFGGAETEYLFSFGSVFRIGDIDEYPHPDGELWFIKLTLTMDKDPELVCLTDYIWSHNLHGRIDLSSFARLMIDMGEHEKAEEVYSTLLGQLSYREDLGFVYHQLGYIRQIKGDWKYALELYRKALEYIPESERERGYSTVATLLCMAQVYCDQSNWNLSLEYIHRALAAIDARDESIKNVSVAEQQSHCLHMIGTVFLEQHRLDEAAEYFERALEIRRRILPSTHPSLATSYNDLGVLYHRQESYEQALSAYDSCLQIRRRSLPETHPALAIIYNNMANTLYWLEREKEAMEFSLRAVDIGTHSLGENHPMTSTFRDTLEGICSANEED